MLKRLTPIIILAPFTLAILPTIHPGKKALTILLNAEGFAAVATPNMGRGGLNIIIHHVVIDALDLLREGTGVAGQDVLYGLEGNKGNRFRSNFNWRKDGNKLNFNWRNKGNKLEFNWKQGEKIKFNWKETRETN